MSDFENYSQTSKSYDATRTAIGESIILGCLASSRPLHETVLLDAGCGTGNYATALLPHVRHLIGVDLNPGMLSAARRKLRDPIGSGKVQLRHGDLGALPLDDNSVDAVMLNQVLHHLRDRGADGWSQRRKVLAEFARVLRPGGTVVINACMPVQLRESWWFFALIPEAVERLCERHPDHREYQQLFEDAGFDFHGRLVPVDALVQGAHYFDSKGPMSERWREGDSTWALATPAELERALARLNALHTVDGNDEAARQFVREHDQRRQELGQITFMHAGLTAQ